MPATLVKFLRFPAGQFLEDLNKLAPIGKVKLQIGENTDIDLTDEQTTEIGIRRIKLTSVLDGSAATAEVRRRGILVKSAALDSEVAKQMPYLVLVELLRKHRSRVLVAARRSAAYVALPSASFLAAIAIAQAAADILQAKYVSVLLRLDEVLLFGSLGAFGATTFMEGPRVLPDQPSWWQRVRDPLSVALIAVVAAAILNLITHS